MRILCIRYKNTKGIFEGGERGAEERYECLCGVVGKENVDTLYIHDENKRRGLMVYLRGVLYFPQDYHFGLTPRRVKEIVHLIHGYDAVWIDRSVFGIIAKELKLSKYKGKIIVFFHNVEPIYFDAKLKKHLPFRNVILRCADHNDKYSIRYADTVVTLTSRDSRLLMERYGRGADIIAPIVMRDIAENLSALDAPMTGNPPLCTVLAAYFRPNNEGIEWFVKNVYPKVNIRLRIVGKGMNQMREADWMPESVEIVSDAPDLTPYFEEADVMILPLFSGSGMKVKTCESLMYGKNIIATDEALVGYDVDETKMGARCNTAEEFISAINDLCEHPRPRHNEYSRQTFLQKYSMSAVIEKFRRAISI